MPSTFKKIFNSREKLNQEINPSGELDKYYFENFYINSWYNKPFYGRVDTMGFVVIPKEQKLRFASFGSDTRQVQALDFVSELFKEIKKEYSINYNNGNLNNKSNIFKKNLEATKGFVTSRPIYLQAINRTYFQFLDYIIGNNSYQKINDYLTFINEFKIFLSSRNFFITRAGFVESKEYSPLYTGLVLEVYNTNYSDSLEKEKFYLDPNYDAFLEICLKNGFLIDKEIPWRIFCDIRQKKVEQKIIELNENSQIKFKEEDFKNNLQKIFDVYYDKVLPESEKDFDYFKEFITVMEGFYASYIAQYPTYNVIKINNCEQVKILTLNKKNVNIFYTSLELYEFYLKLFFEMRKIEIKDNIDEQVYNYIVDICVSKLRDKFDTSVKQAVCESLSIFNKNISTLPYRERSIVQGGPIKGPA